MHIECIPENNMDCYYNKEWKYLHKNKNNSPLDNFTIIENKINKKMKKIIKCINKGSNYIQNNLIIYRNSFHSRDDRSSTIINMITKKIIQMSNFKDLTSIMQMMLNIRIPTLFSISVKPHFRDPDIYVLFIKKFPLTFTKKDYNKKNASETITNFRSMLKHVYEYISQNWNYNVSNMDQFINNIITIEFLFVQTEKNNNYYIYDSDLYNKFIDKYDVNNFWKNIISNQTKNSEYICYDNKKLLFFIKNFFQKLNHKFLYMLKDYFIYCLIRKISFYTPIASQFDKILSYNINEKNLLMETIYDAFGYYLQSIYEDRYHNEKKNIIITNMFNNMKKYLYKYFENSTMFENTTKKMAKKKIDTLDIIIGKQKYFVDLNDMPPLGDNFYDNFMVINSFYFRKSLELVGQLKNRYNLSFENDMYSFIVNASYDPFNNIVFIPTSIMDDIFIRENADPIYNYGSIGAILGHEIMHCFDNDGALFDYLGHYNMWWSKKDYKNFKIEMKKIKDHYSLLTINGKHINSNISLSENLADIAGLKLSLRAYILKYKKNVNLDKLTDLDKDYLKIFFMRWANTLRTTENNDDIEKMVNIDEHSPNIIRVNAPFSHISEYYQIYNVKPHNQNFLEKNARSTFIDM